jgi:type IV secretion system protein VirD4
MRQHSILIGRTSQGYVKFDGQEHVLLYSRTGQGKTSGFTIPNCFAWPGSLVVLDIKGDAFRATAGWRVSMGQDVYLFDPAAEDQRTHRWDPFASVARASHDRFDQISRAAFLLFPEAAGGGTTNSDKFWEPAARAAFTAVATIVAETPSLPLTISTVFDFFTAGDGFARLQSMVQRRRQAGGPRYSQIAVNGLSDLFNGAVDQVQSIRKTVSTRLQAWFNPRIRAATNASDFDLRNLRRQPMTIYVTVAPGNMSRMRPLLALFFDQLVNLNTDKGPEKDSDIKHQALVILDEFARLGRMDTLAEAAQYVRGYGIRLAYVIQNKAQIRAKYGADAAEDIFDNAGAEIVFGTNDLKLAKELQERLGDNTVQATTKQRPRFWSAFKWDKHSESEHPHRRPLMLAQEISRLPPDEQIVLRAGMLPMRTKRPTWFTDPDFTSRARPVPGIPSLSVEIQEHDGKTTVAVKSGRGQADITPDDVPVDGPDDPPAE